VHVVWIGILQLPDCVRGCRLRMGLEPGTQLITAALYLTAGFKARDAREIPLSHPSLASASVTRFFT
jgi:hypothetical protein